MSRCEHGLSVNVFGDLDNVCMTCISPKDGRSKYLVSKKTQKRAHILSESGDTLCRMLSTGGLSRERYYENNSTDGRRVCHLCLVAADRIAPTSKGGAAMNEIKHWCGLCDSSYLPSESWVHEHPEPQSGPLRDAWLASKLPYMEWLFKTSEGRAWLHEYGDKAILKDPSTPYSLLMHERNSDVYRLKIALADAICSDKGVVPHSAVGLIDRMDLEAATVRISPSQGDDAS